jgi:hypothetical protein
LESLTQLYRLNIAREQRKEPNKPGTMDIPR